VTVCLAYLGGALCPAPIRWLDPCGSGRFVVQHFNVVDQVADVFYTIEIRLRDFHGGEGLFHSAYLFKRLQVGECHDAPPIGPNALLRNQAIRSPVWRCFKIVRVLQERHCSPKKTRQKTLRHGLSPGAPREQRSGFFLLPARPVSTATPAEAAFYEMGRHLSVRQRDCNPRPDFRIASFAIPCLLPIHIYTQTL
jgi:hypothetical protein